MKKVVSLVLGLLFFVTIGGFCHAEEDAPAVKVVLGARYLSQEVDDFKTKRTEYVEYLSGSEIGRSEDDFRNCETETSGFLFSPGIRLWDRITIAGIIGTLGVDYSFDTYEDGVYGGRWDMEGDNALAFGFSADASVFKSNGWEVSVGGQYLTQKADGTPYFTDTTGKKQDLVAWAKEEGATDASADYNTKLQELSFNLVVSKTFDIENKIVNSLKPYVGIEGFTQTLKQDGSATIQGVPTIDGYTDNWKFQKSGVSAIIGIDAKLFNNRLAIGPYGKLGAKQEIGGKATYTF